jgi:NAD(P)-dependent dehydrogenase (short-subunit alcohol dehydrogenase family)
MQQQRRGTILFTGGGYSQWPSQAYASVSIGKAGLRSLALSLAEALQGTGIHVNTITIYDTIQEGSGKYSPARIADEFWKVHQQPGQFETEVGY